MLAVVAPDQDMSSTQNYFTPTTGKGTTHHLGSACMLPPPGLAHTVCFIRTLLVPNSLRPSPSILPGSQPSSPWICQKCSLSPLNSQCIYWVCISLRSLTTEVPICPCYLSEIAQCRDQGAGFRYFADPQDPLTSVPLNMGPHVRGI